MILRPTAQADLDGWAAMMADEETSRYIGGLQGREQSWRGMASMAGSWAILGFGMFSMVDKQTGEWLGRAGPWQPEGWPGTEVGWGIRREAWGKGYALEAATAAIDWAFDHLGWTQVIHCIDPGNVNSQKLAQRLGSTLLRQDHLPPPYHELIIDVWGQSREQWRSRKT
ncbi:RimJ/RimL family protein N-acetyltransferase [Caulobacter ginsengisoli]|uniref:RimJ/RimL family protein N-acetyltransferase n=1 Tax=Caulobacter ginsengisoli TaxID=400775 RepID=A0ABU0IVZ4_9CAUL|nr:GNAT family N-acetyltransferase [Caulobacter ginsengisoli]MDQ0466197.1 RimJ/RimL family protein N-acetyltransferase [Caulobacter ginsengisoli]